MGYRARTRMGVDVFRFEGDLSAAEMVRVKSRLTRLLHRNHKRLLLDLKRARRVELAALGILVDRLMMVRARKGDIKLCNLRPEVEHALRLVGVNNLIEFFNSEEEAIRSFAAPACSR